MYDSSTATPSPNESSIMHTFRVQTQFPQSQFPRAHFRGNLQALVQECLNRAAPPQDATWSPLVNVVDEAERYVLALDLPGVDPATVAIEVDKQLLSVSGERKLEANSGTVRSERAVGSFKRSFRLPEGVDLDQIQAVGKFGVLEISIPKQAAKTARRIEVQTH